MKPPAFWSSSAAGPGGQVARMLLTPLSVVQSAATANRMKARGRAVDAAVICVGNLTLGGSGKTPVTAAILDALNKTHSAHGLSRGYGGRLKGPVRTRPDTHGYRDTGDEPLLLARHGTIWISRDRAAGALRAVADGADVVVMDDGFQNPALHKDLSLLVVDGEAGWGNGCVFPAGPLREPVSTGLARADAVIVMMPGPEATPDYESLGLADLEKPVLRAWLEPGEAPPPGPIVAFAGIGRPGKFFDSLRGHGGDVVETRGFADHHPYTPGEIERLADLAEGLDATLVTTEKDAVRLPPESRASVSVFPVSARFADEGAFAALLQSGMDAAAARGVKRLAK